jgi:hypothetical protein
LVAYEGFNYGSSLLSGQNGGTGWASAWTYAGSQYSQLSTKTAGLSYSGISSTGGSAGGDYDLIGIETRQISPISTGDIWISFLANFDNRGNGGDMVRFSGFAVGANTSNEWYLYDATLSESSGVATGVTANYGATHLALIHLDYHANSTTLWMDPSLNGFTGQGGFTLSGLAPTLSSVGLYGSSGSQFDEFRIGTTAQDVGVVSEPASIALAALALVGLSCTRRKQGPHNSLALRAV